MDPKRVARKKAASLLKSFFEHLTGRLATGTADLWQKVEHRRSQRPTAPETGAPPDALRTPMQQQPVQQQQAQTKAEDK